MIPRPRLAAFGAAVWLAAAAPALPDTLTGEVRGTVLDVDGRVPLADVTVTLIHAARGWRKQTVSDSAGSYVFVQLEPGQYSLVFEKEGYHRFERPEIGVRLNQLKVVVPPLELLKAAPTHTRQMTLRGEQTKTAIIDLTSAGTSPAILAFIQEPGRTALVGLGDSALHFNVEGALLRKLPLRGTRSFDQLALLAPGVFRVPVSTIAGPAVGIGIGTAGELSVNGLRGRNNNFTVDGSDNNDEEIGVRRQGFLAAVPQSSESVEEFQVLTAGFPAEFGRNSGSMVNAVSRSGEKSLHGTLYGYWSGAALDAREPFEVPFSDTVNGGGGFRGKDRDRRSYGAVVGGPLASERQFYFASAERQTERGTALRHFVVPAPAERGLRTRTGFVPIEELGAFFAARALDYSDAAGKGLFGLYPLPNDPSGPFGAHTYSEARRYDGGGTIASLKLDRYLSPVHGAFARYNVTDDRVLLPFTSEALRSSVQTATRTQNLSLHLNSTTPRLGNSLRFSFGRTRLEFPPEGGSPLLFGPPPAKGVSTAEIETPYGRFGPFGATGPIGQLSILPYSPIGIDVFNFPQGRVDNTYQASDSVTLTRGAHLWKVGADFRRSQLNSFADRNSRPLVLVTGGQVSSGCRSDPTCPFATSDGLLRGTDLAALGAPAGFLQTLSTGPAADSHIGLRLARYELFVQDTWRVRPNLTLDLGLRYDLERVPREANGRIESGFHRTAADFGHLAPTGSAANRQIIESGNRAFDRAFDALNGFIAGRDAIYDADRNNLAPRLGAAWDPGGRGSMAVRASYGLAFDANIGAVTSHARNVFPTFVPANLDLTFLSPNGSLLNSPAFLVFRPTATPLVRPGTLNTYNLTGDAFATGLGSLFVQSLPSPFADPSSNGLAFTLPVRDLPSGRARQVSISVERQLGESHLVSLGYVGTRGENLVRFATPNAGLVSTPILFASADTPLRLLAFAPSTDPLAGSRAERGLGAYSTIENSARSSYHSMQLQFETRSARIQGRAAWTWSHAIDDVSDPFEGRGFFALPQDATRPDLERASASFDVRHRVAGFLAWEPAHPGGIAALRDWLVSAIVELQTGQPFTVQTSVDRNRDGNLTDRLDSVRGIVTRRGSPQLLALEPGVETTGLLARAGEAGRVGRNTFRAAGIASVDLALARVIPLGEPIKLDVRLEAFNVFNRAHYGVPIRVLESPGFGRSFDAHVGARSLRLSARIFF